MGESVARPVEGKRGGKVRSRVCPFWVGMIFQVVMRSERKLEDA